jgi:hypothetical protein
MVSATLGLDPFYSLLCILILLLTPGVYYFYRNEYQLEDAVKISVLIGFAMIPTYFIFFLYPLSLLFGVVLANIPDYWTIFTQLDLLKIFIDMLVFGVMISIPTQLSFFLVDFFKK